MCVECGKVEKKKLNYYSSNSLQQMTESSLKSILTKNVINYFTSPPPPPLIYLMLHFFLFFAFFCFFCWTCGHGACACGPEKKIELLYSKMTTKESSLKSILTKCNQLHLLSDVPKDKVDAFTAQILKLNKQYPGGLQSYVAKARKLLKDKLEDRNPFEGFVPHVPPGEKIRSNDIKNFEFKSCVIVRRV